MSNFKLEYSIDFRPAKSWIASGYSPSQWRKCFRPNYSKKYTTRHNPNASKNTHFVWVPEFVLLLLNKRPTDFICWFFIRRGWDCLESLALNGSTHFAFSGICRKQNRLRPLLAPRLNQRQSFRCKFTNSLGIFHRQFRNFGQRSFFRSWISIEILKYYYANFY